MIRSTILIISLLSGIPGVAMSGEPPKPDSALAADTLHNEKNELIVLPVVFYSPETGLAVGIYPALLFRVAPGCRPSSISLPVYYTTKKQFAVNLEFGITLPENRHNFSGNIYFEKWPNVFYGIGSDASADNTDDYTSRNAGFFLGYKRRFFKSFYLGIDCLLFNREYLEYPDSGRFITGDIRGSEAGRLTAPGISIVWDDRDNIIYPGKGYYAALSVGFYGDNFGGDYAFEKYAIDLRKYLTLRSPEALSAQAAAVFIDGDPPFWGMPRIGDYIRGHKPMRFIDRNLLAFQLEYRIHPIWKRFGLALFAGTGAVGDKISTFAPDYFKFAAGFGIRYLFLAGENLNIRLDFGIGGESTEIYLEAGEAF